MSSGFVLPIYPQDRLAALRKQVTSLGLELVDLSIGTPYDPMPDLPTLDKVSSDLNRGYPKSIGSSEFIDAVISYVDRRFGISVKTNEVAACVGSKEFVASVALYLKLRSPNKGTVLYPGVSYPTYAMGASIASCKAVAVPIRQDGELDLSGIDSKVLQDTLCLWLNSPANPTGKISSGNQAMELAREYDFLVISDECYAEFSFKSAPQSILANGSQNVLALHSLSKRSNFAGGRVGFYVGDSDYVHFLSEIRKHAGLMIPGMMQAMAMSLLGDTDHVELQKQRYKIRLEILLDIVRKLGYVADFPDGGFYIWLHDERFAKDGFEIASDIACKTGILGSPGEFYGKESSQYLRLAAVTSTEKLSEISAKL